jgi:hypothetical protein
LPLSLLLKMDPLLARAALGDPAAEEEWVELGSNRSSPLFDGRMSKPTSPSLTTKNLNLTICLKACAIRSAVPAGPAVEDQEAAKVAHPQMARAALLLMAKVVLLPMDKVALVAQAAAVTICAPSSKRCARRSPMA